MFCRNRIFTCIPALHSYFSIDGGYMPSKERPILMNTQTPASTTPAVSNATPKDGIAPVEKKSEQGPANVEKPVPAVATKS
jgi:hypothetical protein